ncbi:MAG: DUF624 domain-containing protein [Lachnospiraceae bacterium]|jgi:uncharacterized membrane protein YesL|nr:DUF624 domain-containing protein [Lachnospiraceae bacterium]
MGFNMEKLMSFFDYVYYFFVLNILFQLSNIPFLGFYFLVGISSIGEYLPLFLLCLLPMAPSLCALFHCMNKLVKNKDIYPFREYFKGYRMNFMQSAAMGVIQLMAVFMLCTSIKYFVHVPKVAIFTVTFILVLAVIILMTPFLYLFISRYIMKNIQIIKNAFAIVIGKPLYALANAVIFLFMLVLFEVMAGTTFLFMGSIYSFLIVITNRKLFSKLESE